MKTIGLLGGMSAHSTMEYYRILCALTAERLGGLSSPELLIRSVDFARIEAMQRANVWDDAGAELHREALALQKAGAGVLLLATNTMHIVESVITRGLRVPFIHIAGPTAAAIRAAGLRRPGLMATAFTMEQRFYTDRLRADGLDPIVPSDEDRKLVHRVIYDELCKGTVTAESERAYVDVARRLAEAGADSLILGCTEVGMLLNAANSPLPVFDTVHLHCAAALDLALDGTTTARRAG